MQTDLNAPPILIAIFQGWKENEIMNLGVLSEMTSVIIQSRSWLEGQLNLGLNRFFSHFLQISLELQKNSVGTASP